MVYSQAAPITPGERPPRTVASSPQTSIPGGRFWLMRVKNSNPSAFYGVFVVVKNTNATAARRFRVSASIAEKIESRQRRVEERLDRFNFPEDMSRPMMRGTNLHYDLAGRDIGTAYGGIGLFQQFAQRLEL